MKFTTKYNYKAKSGLVNTEESKAYQECKDDCNINLMYKRYLSKGFTPPNVVALEQRYADISEAQTFEEMLNVQNDVKSMFNDLPSDIREACGYNVDNFIGLISEVQEDIEVKGLQDKVFETLNMKQRKQEIFYKENPIKPELPKEELKPLLEPKGEQS